MNMKSKGFTLVELLVVIGILGTLMAVLMPALSGIKTTSDLNEMMLNGSKIVKDIATNSKDLWAHRTVDDGLTEDPGEVSSQAFSTSTDYFKALFDIQNQAGNSWNPKVDGDLLSSLWVKNVPKPAQPGQLTKDNVGWTIVSGLGSGAPDSIPVWVSRNVDTSTFAKSGTQNMNQDTLVNIEKYPQPFQGKGGVVIYKAGDGAYFKSDDAKLKTIYKKNTMCRLGESASIEYLIP